MIKHSVDYLIESSIGNKKRVVESDLESFRWLEIAGNALSFILNDKVYHAKLLSISKDCKIAKIVIDNQTIELSLKDQLDELIDKMGLSDTAEEFTGEVHSPMPGLVLKVLASEGDSIEKGDSILVLEAMKMENMIQAPASGIIQKISCKTGQTVNKGDLLVHIA